MVARPGLEVLMGGAFKVFWMVKDSRKSQSRVSNKSFWCSTEMFVNLCSFVIMFKFCVDVRCSFFLRLGVLLLEFFLFDFSIYFSVL